MYKKKTLTLIGRLYAYIGIETDPMDNEWRLGLVFDRYEFLGFDLGPIFWGLAW